MLHKGRHVFTAVWITICLIAGSTAHAGADTDRIYRLLGPKKNLQEAYNRAERLKASYPKDHSLWYIQGQAFWEAGQHQKAYDHFTKAIDLGRSTGDVYFWRALMGNILQKFDSALADINRAIADPGTADQLTGQNRKKGLLADRTIRQDFFARLYYLRATLYLNNFNRYDEAWTDTSRAIQESMEPIPGHYKIRGHLKYLKHDFQAAYQDYNKAVDLDPEMTEAWKGMGQTALYQGQYPEAVRCLEKAVSLDPGTGGAARDLGLAYALAGNTAKALANMGLAINKAPDADNYFHLAYLHHLRGNSAQAQKNFLRAREQDSDILNTRKLWLEIMPDSSPVIPYFRAELDKAATYLAPKTAGSDQAAPGITITGISFSPAPVRRDTAFAVVIDFKAHFPGRAATIPTAFYFTISRDGQVIFTSPSQTIQAGNGKPVQWTHQMNPVPAAGQFTLTAHLSHGRKTAKATQTLDIR